MVFFDYIYFRVTKAYFKWDGRTGFTAILAVSMMQFFIASALAYLAIGRFYTVAETSPHKKIITTIAVFMAAVNIVANYFRYNGKYNILKRKWKDETTNQHFFRGILVIVALVLPWILVLIILIKRSNP